MSVHLSVYLFNTFIIDKSDMAQACSVSLMKKEPSVMIKSILLHHLRNFALRIPPL